MRHILLCCVIILVAACASVSASNAPPNLTPASGAPAPAQARFYAGCIAAAAQANTYDREENTIRFHCAGAPAQHFYEALAPWSAAQNSELSADGRTLRVTQRPERDLSGLDYCWRDASGAHGCTVVLNAGEFLDSE
jgi:hypothetical protein